MAKRTFPRVPVAIKSALFLICSAIPACAKFTICNQTLDVVNVAIGLDIEGEFQTEGWWTIGTNQCANVLQDALPSRYMYIYAQDVFGRSLLQGRANMCIASQKFVIKGISDCWPRGHIEVPFTEVDTYSKESWTVFLD